MMKWARFITVVMVTATFIAGSQGARITTKNGVIEGISDVVDGVTVDIYLGVPFAVPPLGDLRFRAPQPMTNWLGVRETKTQPNCCMQLADTKFGRFSGVDMWNPNTNISEDCLYLNLYVPKTNKASLPTLIWIYGGSYVYGSATLDIYDGRYLAAKESVIVAAMQYRMGAQGFLYMGNDEAPGNMGLLDQQLATKWVHDNIGVFGGDIGRITLFGESAGAASVSHHLLAPSSWPYFTNAIMLSATSLSPWAVDSPANLLSHAQSLAEVMGCDNMEASEIMKCLRQHSATDLENKQWELDNNNVGTFSPTIDGHFLPQHPDKLIASGRIKDTDILLGATKDEGEFFLVYFYDDIFLEERLWNPASLNRSQYEDVMCRIAKCEDDKTGLKREAIKYVYEQSTIPDDRGLYRDILDDILGDVYFKCGVRSLAEAYSSKTDGHTYVYSFEYRHSGNPWPPWMGVLHGYEIEMMFGMPYNTQSEFTYSDLDYNVSSNVMNYISTFANYGNLDSSNSAEWPVYTQASEQHIVFAQDGSTHIRRGFRTKECSFWNYLMPKLQDELSRTSCEQGSDDVTNSVSSITTSSVYACTAVILIMYISRHIFR